MISSLEIQKVGTGAKSVPSLRFVPLLFRVKCSSEIPGFSAKTGYPKRIRRITWVYGTGGDSVKLARISGAKLIEVDNDHRLADPEQLEAMFERVRTRRR